jgi:vitamin B12 transporter
MSTYSRAALVAALSALSAPAFAQAAGADSDVVVVSASRTTLAPAQIGSAVSVTTAADIRAGQMLSVKDALQDAPGVQITSNRPGGLNNVSIRGSDNDQVLFLIDGIELGDPSSTSTQFQTDHLTSLDVSRIEVLRGNQSSLYGSDAIGGVVNIITQRADEDGLKINAEAEAGSENARSGGVTLLGRNGAIDYRLTGTAFAADGPSLADPATGTATEDDAYERWSLSGRVGARIGETIETQVVGFYTDSASDLDNTTSDSDDVLEKKEYGAAFKASHETTDSRWRNELTVSRFNAERTYFGTFYAPEGDVYDGTKDSALYVLNFRPSRVFQVAGGLNWEEEKTEQTTFFSGVFEADITTESAFVELSFQPVDALAVTLAGRVDDNSRFGTFDTYRATAAYSLPGQIAGGDVKLRASYGTGAKAPGLYQLFDPTYGNPDLEVETSEGYDAGVDMVWKTARLEFTLFDTDITNEIGFDGSRPPFGGYAQFGQTRSRGAEFGARFDLAEWMSVSQTLTVLDSQDEDTGLWKGRPRYSGATAVTVEPTERWRVTARVRYRTENASGFGGAADGFQSVDLLTSYDLTKSVELYGRIENVADEDYQLVYGSNAPDFGVFGGIRLRY